VRDTPRTPAARATGTDGHGAIADPQLAAAVDWLMDDLAAASSSLGLTPEHCRAEFEAAVALRVAGGMAYEDAVRREWAALREVVEVRA
jgi:hypothetical protein